MYSISSYFCCIEVHTRHIKIAIFSQAAFRFRGGVGYMAEKPWISGRKPEKAKKMLKTGKRKSFGNQQKLFLSHGKPEIFQIIAETMKLFWKVAETGNALKSCGKLKRPQTATRSCHDYIASPICNHINPYPFIVIQHSGPSIQPLPNHADKPRSSLVLKLRKLENQKKATESWKKIPRKAGNWSPPTPPIHIIWYLGHCQYHIVMCQREQYRPMWKALHYAWPTMIHCSDLHNW